MTLFEALATGAAVLAIGWVGVRLFGRWIDRTEYLLGEHFDDWDGEQ